jgi:hypothetical protein
VPFTYIEAKLQARRACRILRLGLTQRLALIDWMRLIDDSRELPKAHGSEEVLQKAKTLLISFRLMCITWAMNHVVWSRCISLQYVKGKEMTDSGWFYVSWLSSICTRQHRPNSGHQKLFVPLLCATTCWMSASLWAHSGTFRNG